MIISLFIPSSSAKWLTNSCIGTSQCICDNPLWCKSNSPYERLYSYLSEQVGAIRIFTWGCHWPQYMDSWLARICILVNACHRKPLDSHFTPVKTLDRHTDLCTCQCMKCNRWQVFSFKFHENSEKKNGKVPQIFKSLRYLLKIVTKICCKSQQCLVPMDNVK